MTDDTHSVAQGQSHEPVAWMNSEHIDGYRSGKKDGIAWAAPRESIFYNVALYALAPGNPGAVEADAEDEAYEIGRLDGYESAVQDFDLATGGDGEFKGSTIYGETVDVPAMKARVIARCNTPSPSPATQPQPDSKEGDATADEAYRLFPDVVEPADYHPLGKITADRGNLRFAFIMGATWAQTALTARVDAPAAPPADAVRAWQPTEMQVNSACLSFRHDFGLLDEVERKVLQFTAREFLCAWQKEGAGSDRNEIIEKCALVVDQANREGPYQAIAAASRIRALKSAALPPDAGSSK